MIYFTKLQLIKEILTFRSLQESWDGYGALPLEVDSAMNAIKMLDYVEDDIYGRETEIFPNPHGTITFRWENNIGQVLSLEIGNLFMSYYVEIEKGNPTFFNYKNFNRTEFEKIAETVNRYF